MIDALGYEKPGSLIEVGGMPYRLYKGWDLATIKAEARVAEATSPASFRCRIGWHDKEIIGEPEPLPPNVPHDLLHHFIWLSGRSGQLKRCKRCGELSVTTPSAI